MSIQLEWPRLSDTCRCHLADINTCLQMTAEGATIFDRTAAYHAHAFGRLFPKFTSNIQASADGSEDNNPCNYVCLTGFGSVKAFSGRHCSIEVRAKTNGMST